MFRNKSNILSILAIVLITAIATAIVAPQLMKNTTTTTLTTTTTSPITTTTTATLTTISSTTATSTATKTTTSTATTTSVSTTTATSTYTPKVILRLATTTSFDATGLLAALKPFFEAQNPNINLTWVAVGTGQALEIGKRGDADVVLVHARAQEDQFISDGYGIHGITIAYNDFVILGPSNDPAGINSTSTAAEAFKKISELGAQGQAKFVSRGDLSGTHTKEKEIWKKAGVNYTGQPWYVEVGQGMLQTLRMAENLQGYVLTDRATYYSIIQELTLPLLFEKDPILLNPYRVMLINPAKFSYVHYAEAHKFILFLVSPEIQNFIGNYTKGGQKLFNPVFGNTSTIGINDPYEDQEVAYWKSKLQG